MTGLNAAAYLLALLLALGGVLLMARPAAAGDAASAAVAPALVRDARGAELPVRPWRRIASLDLVSDELLGELAEPGRICAVSAWVQGPSAWRHAAVPRIRGLEDLEGAQGLLGQLRPSGHDPDVEQQGEGPRILGGEAAGALHQAKRLVQVRW